ncbi:MAG: ABC transporter ATP-binding protein, partial [Opitutales bacterium]|nr:ABC transporter ATP-binding protein [Opitutales bacterium]
HIGYLPEAPYFQKFLTGREFVQSMGRLSGLKRNELNERTRSVLEQVDMTGAADRRIGTYSKGMLQRIGLAQALVHDPDFLILDEPTAGVDPIGSAAIARLILDLKRTGKSILLCSHLLTEVEGLCDQLLMLYRGRMLLSGTTEDILEAGDVWSLQVSGYAMNRESAARMALEVEGLKLISARASGRHLSDVFLEKIHAVEADRDD